MRRARSRSSPRYAADEWTASKTGRARNNTGRDSSVSRSLSRFRSKSRSRSLTPSRSRSRSPSRSRTPSPLFERKRWVPDWRSPGKANPLKRGRSWSVRSASVPRPAMRSRWTPSRSSKKGRSPSRSRSLSSVPRKRRKSISPPDIIFDKNRPNPKSPVDVPDYDSEEFISGNKRQPSPKAKVASLPKAAPKAKYGGYRQVAMANSQSGLNSSLQKQLSTKQPQDEPKAVPMSDVKARRVKKPKTKILTVFGWPLPEGFESCAPAALQQLFIGTYGTVYGNQAYLSSVATGQIPGPDEEWTSGSEDEEPKALKSNDAHMEVDRDREETTAPPSMKDGQGPVKTITNSSTEGFFPPASASESKTKSSKPSKASISKLSVAAQELHVPDDAPVEAPRTGLAAKVAQLPPKAPEPLVQPPPKKEVVPSQPISKKEPSAPVQKKEAPAPVKNEAPLAVTSPPPNPISVKMPRKLKMILRGVDEREFKGDVSMLASLAEDKIDDFAGIQGLLRVLLVGEYICPENGKINLEAGTQGNCTFDFPGQDVDFGFWSAAPWKSKDGVCEAVARAMRLPLETFKTGDILLFFSGSEACQQIWGKSYVTLKFSQLGKPGVEFEGFLKAEGDESNCKSKEAAKKCLQGLVPAVPEIPEEEKLKFKEKFEWCGDWELLLEDAHPNAVKTFLGTDLYADVLGNGIFVAGQAVLVFKPGFSVYYLTSQGDSGPVVGNYVLLDGDREFDRAIVSKLGLGRLEGLAALTDCEALCGKGSLKIMEKGQENTLDGGVWRPVARA